MTPRNFADRMQAAVIASEGDAEVLKLTAFEIAVRCLADLGYGEGLRILYAALSEPSQAQVQQEPSATAQAALAVEAARHG